MPQKTLPDDVALPTPAAEEGAQFPIVGIGASAGGLEAFTQFLRALPLDTGMAFVLVQHLSPTHDSALAQILSRATRMPVMEVHDQSVVEPNHVYVIPPNRCMGIVGGMLQLEPREKAGHTRVVDHFFRALAEERRHQAIGIVLSGNANDGTHGLEAIKAEGGITFAQDDSAQCDGMPHSAIASGCVDLVMSPEQIAQEVARIAWHFDSVSAFSMSESDGKPRLDRVLQLLHRATGVDFAQYKFNTVFRRITRRMVLQKQSDLDAYANLLEHDTEEMTALYRDILINVTSFFRNPEAFETLKEEVFPRLLQNRSPQEPVRVWTLGCSTGQEAYSVAMAFMEFAEAQGSTVPLQIFATDLSEECVDIARLGIYSKDIEQDVSPERLRRFFVEVEGRYRISKAIRDNCVFSRHNVLVDPPFSRLDLVTCRNLLIYLAQALQQKIVPTLHYALKPAGFLWLGASETIGGFRNLFDAIDAKQKIYARNPATRGTHRLLQNSAGPRAAFVPITSRLAAVPAPELHREADRLLLTRFAPPSVLVSSDFDILQYRGDTSPYLAPSPGKATLHLPKMLREGLLVGVRAALLRAGKAGTSVREDGLRVKSHDGWRDVSVEVVPLADGTLEGGYLVLFHEPERPSIRNTPANEASPQLDSVSLERELAATRDYLQSVIDQQEVANEALQSSNEEIQSANEELQSINEELETSKEEIQSSNEELATVNDELNHRNTELNRLNDDLVNVFDSVQMPIVLIGIDMRVRRFTPAAEKLLDLMPRDVGQPVSFIRSRQIDLPDLEPLLGEVLDSASNREIGMRDKRGNRHLARLRPYRTRDNRIDGVVLVLVDVEMLKRAHERTENIIATVREPLVVLDADLRIQMASGSFYRHFGVHREATEGRLLFELGNGQWNIDRLRHLLEQLLVRDTEFNDFEVQHDFEQLGRRTMLLNARRLLQLEHRSPVVILLAIEDVTERKQVLDAARLASIVNSSADAIVSKNLDGIIQSWNRGAQKLFGYTPEEAIGQPIGMLIPDDHLDEEPHILERIRAGEAIEHYETVRKRKDGSLLDISLTVSPVHDASGRIVGASKVARDISESKRARDALLESEERLRQSAAQLADADRRKNEFLAMLAHEMRNPLAPIRNALEILRRTGGQGDVTESAIEMMERQVAQMVRLVDDLLDVNRISRGKVELRRVPVDLTSIVQQAVEIARPICDQKGVLLTVGLSAETVILHADPLRLVQALGNLLHNACKFTDKGGGAWVDVEREGDEAVIRVRDSGIGITAEQLPRIFDMFVQADTSLERSSSGLGIGLSLVKSLVELHGGTVRATSAGKGQGSEFVVRLPIAVGLSATVAPPSSNVAEVVAAPTARNILVVDDNRDAAESLAELLQLSGHETRVAYDGLGAVEMAASFRPDLVLLDIGLPNMNGYEAAKGIRELPGGRDTVLVALTGWGHQDDRQRSSEAGFDKHLVKPVHPDVLLKLIEDIPARDARSPR
ncbi:chemotaxis protein CheB [Hydrogenophaga sp. 2FB]|uniref:chemotaxis protein CheB n=1 Tax=Hydrogenophaga sp. 2FB TaxID=2502187 RepID=UPI0014859566|nr:chemotaxis protein CheB [Hydrogenophaga sp. 2FB]